MEFVCDFEEVEVGVANDGDRGCWVCVLYLFE